MHTACSAIHKKVFLCIGSRIYVNKLQVNDINVLIDYRLRGTIRAILVIFSDLLVIFSTKKKQLALDCVRIKFYDLRSNLFFESEANLLLTNWGQVHVLDGMDNFVYFLKPGKHHYLMRMKWFDIIPQRLRTKYKQTTNKRKSSSIVLRQQLN